MMIAVFSLFLFGCDEDVVSDSKRSSKSRKFPVQRTLIDVKGRELDVKIIAKTQTEVVFVKRGNPKEYRYPIAQLSLEDQKFLSAFPAQKMQSAYVKSVMAEVRRLEEKIASNKDEILRNPGSQTRVRMLEREIKKMETERDRLKDQAKQRGG